MRYHYRMTWELHKGDALAILREMPSASVDAVVTDPPYGLEFMGKAWDSFGKDSGPGYQETPRFTDRGGASPEGAPTRGRLCLGPEPFGQLERGMVWHIDPSWSVTPPDA